jgi:hypothetical protein
MQNLRFRVITYPYIQSDPGQPPPEVEVGRAASILIRGGRLWRSPIVRLGTQKADKVEVLPDMQGVIAQFECVYPAPGTGGTVPSRSQSAVSSPPEATNYPSGPSPETTGELQVFTSEGPTIPIRVVRKPFTVRSGGADDPCWMHDKAARSRRESGTVASKGAAPTSSTGATISTGPAASMP